MQIEIMPGNHFQQCFIINNSYISTGVSAFQFSLLFSNLVFICYCMWSVHNNIYILSILYLNCLILQTLWDKTEHTVNKANLYFRILYCISQWEEVVLLEIPSCTGRKQMGRNFSDSAFRQGGTTRKNMD